MAGEDGILAVINGFVNGLNRGLDKREERRLKNEQIDLMKEQNSIRQEGVENAYRLGLAKVRLLSEKANAKAKEITLSPGEKQLDKNFVKDYNSTFVQGNYQEAVNNIDRLEKLLNVELPGIKNKAADKKIPGRGAIGNIVGEMLDRDKVSGGLTQASLATAEDLPLKLGVPAKFWRSQLYPDAVKFQQDVNKAIVAGLRAAYGAQFTQSENFDYKAMTWDPRLGEETNIERVQELIKKIRVEANSKLAAGKYFEEHGTLKGYKPAKGLTMPSFYTESGDKKKKSDLYSENRKFWMDQEDQDTEDETLYADEDEDEIDTILSTELDKKQKKRR